MKTIFEVSSRTRNKIIRRLKLECSNCGWSESYGDIHHIIPLSKGGTSEHTNLTYLCPNCHRLAHTGKLVTFQTLEDQIGDKWKDYYAQSNVPKNREVWTKGKKKGLETRRKKYEEKCIILLGEIKSSGINFSKRGWVEQVARNFGIAHQHVSKFIRRFDPEFYSICYKRRDYTAKDAAPSVKRES